MVICKNCSGDKFDKQDGYFYCQRCNLVSEDIRDELVDFMTFSQSQRSATIRIRKTSVDAESSDSKLSTAEPVGPVRNWNVYEAFTIVLRQMTHDCIRCGAPPEIEPVIFTLWAQYLRKLNVAFGGNLPDSGLTTSDEEDEDDLEGSRKKRPLIFCHRSDPLVARKARKRRKRRKSGSQSETDYESGSDRENRRIKKRLIKSFVEREMSETDTSIDSRECTEDEEDPEQPTIRQKRSRTTTFLKVLSEWADPGVEQVPDVINGVIREAEYLSIGRLLCFVYLGIRLTQSNLGIFDIVRWVLEGHIVYYEAWKLLATEVPIGGMDLAIFGKNTGSFAAIPSSPHLRSKSIKLASVLGLDTLPKQPILPFIERIVADLQLPSDVVSIAVKLMTDMYNSDNHTPKEDVTLFTLCTAEMQAVCWILVVMKTVLGLDGVTEYLWSDVAQKANSALGVTAWPYSPDEVSPKVVLFDFQAWVRFIELRTHILIKKGVSLYKTPQVYNFNCTTWERFCNVTHFETSRPKPVLNANDKKKRSRPFKSFFAEISQAKPPKPLGRTPTLLSHHGLVQNFVKLGTVTKAEAYHLHQNFPGTQFECFLDPRGMNEMLQPLGVQIRWTAALSRKVNVKPFWHGSREKNIYANVGKRIRKSTRVRNVEDPYTNVKALSSSQTDVHDITSPLPLPYYWVYRGATKRISQMDWECFIQELPPSFLWILNTLSTLIWEDPRDIYEDMWRLEALLFHTHMKNDY